MKRTFVMKFEKERLKFVIPIAVVVCVSSNVMLFSKFKEVASFDKFMIMIGATIISAVIAYFLFPQDKKEKPDPLPKTKKK